MTASSVSLGLVRLVFLYADPGSGMLLWQLITAAALGLLFYARTIVRKIRTMIGTGHEETRSTSDRD
jgi:hypothetical protein